MVRANHSRKRALRIALAAAGKTQEQLADECGVTAGHLSHVMSGKRESVTLMEKVNAFIDEHLPSGNGAAA
jgi:transcriptional regulator with XRE-family HTH domain